MAKKPSVIVIDNVLSDPQSYRNFALSHEFHEDNRFYKGYRTAGGCADIRFKEIFERHIGERIATWNEYDTNGCFHLTWAGMPRVYHADHTDYAAALYLSPNAPLVGGTSFWQSRRTGVWTVEPDGVDAPATFDNALLDQTQWEMADTVANRFNRLVIWKSRLVHSVNEHFGYDQASGRLVQLFFFNVG